MDTFTKLLANNVTIYGTRNVLETEKGLLDEYLNHSEKASVALMRDFVNVCLEKDMCPSKEMIKNNDIIDVRNLFKDVVHIQELFPKGNKIFVPCNQKDNPWAMPCIFDDSFKKLLPREYEEFRETNDIFSFIPCFERGSLKINSKRWLVFQVGEVVIDDASGEQYCVVSLTDMFQDVNIGMAVPRAVDSFVIRREWDKENQCYALALRPTESQSIGAAQIFGIAEHPEMKDDLKWSELDYKLWEDEVIVDTFKVESAKGNYYKKFIDLEFDPFCEDKISASIYENRLIFTTAIFHINRMLKNEKLSHARKYTKTVPSKTTANNDSLVEEKYINKRKIRTLGDTGISIVSEKPPRTPDSEYIRHYSVAKWTVRGTVRTYKSGRQVWIPPHTAHRHCFEDKDGVIKDTPQTIRVSKRYQVNKDESEE